MNRYGTLAADFWRDARRLPEQDRLALAYLLTCRHRVLGGLFRLPVSYMGDDLGWSTGQAVQALSQLAEAGEVIHDPGQELIFVVGWRRHDPLPNCSAAASAALRVRDEIRRAPTSPAVLAAAATLHLEAARLLAAASQRDASRDKLTKILSEIALEAKGSALPTVPPTVGPPSPPPSERFGEVRCGEVDSSLFPITNNLDTPPGVPRKRVSRAKKERDSGTPPEARRLAQLLADLIRQRDPKAKVHPDNWAVDLDKLNRLDGRDWTEIEHVLRWTQEDPFEQTVVLSAGKLRQRFTGLLAKTVRATSPSTATATPMNDAAAARLKREAELAAEGRG